MENNKTLTATQTIAAAIQAIAAVRERAPLVHCVTAAVSMNFVADGLLAAGARPMMTETAAEAPTMNQVADALLVNLGTLSTDGSAGIAPTVAAARDRTIPWVLDPAAVGVAPVRTALARELLIQSPTVVRANASEVSALTGGAGGRGADSVLDSRDASRCAHALGQEYGCTIAISGDPDIIVGADGTAFTIANGVELLTRVTGTGCLLGGLAAACSTVATGPIAAVAATIWMGIAAERAYANTQSPGSFKVALIDELFQVTLRDLSEGVRLELA